MSIEKAKKHYLGKDGYEKLNCAQSILKVFSGLDQDQKETLCKGGGQAPGGVCGAFCAAKHLLEKNHSEKLKEFVDYFKNVAGSLNCREIRAMRKLSCVGCVEKAAEYLDANR